VQEGRLESELKSKMFTVVKSESSILALSL